MKHFFYILFIISCVQKKPKAPVYEKNQIDYCQSVASSFYLLDNTQNHLQDVQTTSQKTEHDRIFVTKARVDETPESLRPYIFANTISFYATEKKYSLALTKKDGNAKKQNIFQDVAKNTTQHFRQFTPYEIHKKTQITKKDITIAEKDLTKNIGQETFQKLNDNDDLTIKKIAELEVEIEDVLSKNLNERLAIKYIKEDSEQYSKDKNQGLKDIKSWTRQMKNDYKEWRFLKIQLTSNLPKHSIQSVSSLIERIESRYLATKPENYEHQEQRSYADDLANENVRQLSLQWFQIKKLQYLKSEELTALQKEKNRRKTGPWQEISFQAQDTLQKYRIPIMISLSAIAAVQLYKFFQEDDPQVVIQKKDSEKPEEKIWTLRPFRPDGDDETENHEDLVVLQLTTRPNQIRALTTIEPELCR